MSPDGETLGERVVVLVGPTASGKTALSIALARRLDGEIVNTDSVLTYRDMNIGSAKPTLEERLGVPHHLVDVWGVEHDATVAEFQGLARAAIADIQARGKTPILVGGSALYVRAVIDPLDFPGTDPRVRAKWQARGEEIGPEALHAELAVLDPVAAAQILPTNARRVVRALEVIEMTGEPFKASLPAYESIYPDLVMLGLEVDRAVLDARIVQRVEDMWAARFVDEVRHVHGLAGSPTASRAIGYQQVLAFLAGLLSEAEAKEETVAGTRRLARRQERMLHKDRRITWFAHDDDDLLDKALKATRRYRDTVG